MNSKDVAERDSVVPKLEKDPSWAQNEIPGVVGNQRKGLRLRQEVNYNPDAYFATHLRQKNTTRMEELAEMMVRTLKNQTDALMS